MNVISLQFSGKLMYSETPCTVQIQAKRDLNGQMYADYTVQAVVGGKTQMYRAEMLSIADQADLSYLTAKVNDICEQLNQLR